MEPEIRKTARIATILLQQPNMASVCRLGRDAEFFEPRVAWARKPSSPTRHFNTPGPASPGLAEPLRFLKVDRNELADAALGHGDAEQAVHAGHRDRVVGD